MGEPIFLANDDQAAIAEQVKPEWKPEADLPHNLTRFQDT